MATDEAIKRKREAPSRYSQTAGTKTGQHKKTLVYHRLSLLDNSSKHVHDGDGFKPMDEELANVAGEQFVALDDCHNPYGDVGYGPIRIVRPESVQSGQAKLPGSRIKPGAKKTSTKKNSLGLNKNCKRKMGRPAGFKSSKNKIVQKPALSDSSCGGNNYSNGDKDDNFEPPTPMRKRGRLARSKYARRNMEQEPILVDSSGSSSEGMKDKDDDFQPEVSGDGDGRKKYARINAAALKRAVEVEKKLPAEGPTFYKCMMHSQVVQGFWLGIPASFCRDHLPNHDDTIVLEDEEGKNYETNYIAYKMGLSGGWKGFVKQKHLKVDDAVVFQLVRPRTFKVYILRENEFTATDGVLGLLSLDTPLDNSTSKKEERSDDYAKFKEAADGHIGSPGADIDDFASVKSLVDFKIVIGDGLLVLPDHLRRAYYELCQAQKAFVHKNLLKHLSHELTTQLIVETANIGVGIKASSPASIDDLARWKKTLEGLEYMGMDVSLMRKRVDDLLGLLSAPSQASMMPERYEAVKLERARAAEELRAIELRVSILNDSLKDMDVKMEEMVEASARKKEEAVRKLATAPW